MRVTKKREEGSEEGEGRVRTSPKIRKVRRHEKKQRGSRWRTSPGRLKEERLYRVYRDFMQPIIVSDTKDAPGTMRDISETGER